MGKFSSVVSMSPSVSILEMNNKNILYIIYYKYHELYIWIEHRQMTPETLEFTVSQRELGGVGM